MRQYYIYDGDVKKGPFVLEQLPEQSLKKDMLVWYEGLGDWTKAEKITELQPLLTAMPPPLPKNAEKNINRHEIINSFSDAEEIYDNDKRSLLLPVLITLVIIAGILITLFYYRNKLHGV